MSDSPRILLLYSNPSDSDRIRLDREHKAMDKLLKDLNLNPSVINRFHAVSVSDFPQLLSENQYEILHFSGHGTPDGIYLERDHAESGRTVTPQQLASIIKASQRPRAIVLMSCYSSAAVSQLASAAPFIITISGTAGDKGCIQFTDSFYRYYLKSPSVERAFAVACTELGFYGLEDSLSPCLTRSALENSDANYYIVDSNRGGDPLLIDVSRVEKQITQLHVNRDKFMSVIGRKIRVHLSTFFSPRERAIVSVGPYFAEFSWQSTDDPIICHRILDLKEKTDQATCEIWASLLFTYNELYAQRYRRAENPASPVFERDLKSVIKTYKETLTSIKQSSIKKALQVTIPKSYKTAISMLSANIDRAEAAYDRKDQRNVIAYLEGALTTIHDLVEALTEFNVVPVADNK